jgi:hypothetical protein
MSKQTLELIVSEIVAGYGKIITPSMSGLLRASRRGKPLMRPMSLQGTPKIAGTPRA